MNEKVRVRDVMVTKLHTIDGLATVQDAMTIMRRHTVSSLVVERRDEDDESGSGRGGGHRPGGGA